MPLDAISVFSILDRVTDANGKPVSGAKINVYEEGTTTRKTVYSDYGLATALPNPIICDSAGYPTSDGVTQVTVYSDADAYKLVITDADDVVIFSRDNIRGADVIPATSSTALPTTPVVSRTSTQSITTSDRGKLINVSGTSTALTLPAATSAGDNFRVGVRHNDPVAGRSMTIRTTGGESIGLPGQASATSVALTGYGQVYWFVCDGAGWHVDTEVPALIGNTTGVILITDRLTAPPASPTGGNRYIINGTPTGAWATLSFSEGQIAESDGNGSWMAYTPRNGWMAWVEDEDILSIYHDAAWNDKTGLDAPSSSVLEVAEYYYDGTGTNTIAATTWTSIGVNITAKAGITGASISAPTITLPTGEYLIFATINALLPQNTTASVRARVYNSTDAATELESLNARAVSVASNNISVSPTLMGHVSITGATEDIVLQWWSSDNNVTLGSTDASGIGNKYASITILDLTSLQGATGPQGPQGEGGLDAAYPYQWSTSTSGDPGTGKIAGNNLTIASITQLQVSDTDSFSASMTNVINAWDNSTSSNRAIIRITKEGAPTNAYDFYITGDVTDQGSYFTIPVSYINQSGTLGNGDDLAVLVVPVGDKGATGASGTAGANTYDTRSAFELATVDTGINRFYTLGYSSAGDGGGAKWKKISTPSPVEAWHLQTANGLYFELDEIMPTPKMFGATAGYGGGDNTTYLQNWLDYCGAKKAFAFWDDIYATTSGITISTGGTSILGLDGDTTNTGTKSRSQFVANTGNTSTMLAVNASNVVIQNLLVVGVSARNNISGGVGIWLGNDYTTISDATISSGTPTLTSASNPFVAGDVGKNICIQGAGTGGASKTFSISAYTSAGQVTLSANADTTVSGGSATFGTLHQGARLTNVSFTSFHGVGLEVGAMQKNVFSGCTFKGFRATKLANRVAPDGGDDAYTDCHFVANSATPGTVLDGGACVYMLAGGGPRYSNCKFLDSYHHILIDWRLGISGGPRLDACSMENCTGYRLYVTGSGVETLNGLHIGNSWLNDGAAYFIDNSAAGWLHRLTIVGNQIISNGTPEPIIDIGQAATWFNISGNQIDGNGGVVTTTTATTNAIVVRSGATYGRIQGNQIKGCTTPISNSSSTTIYEVGDMTNFGWVGTAGHRFRNSSDSATVVALALEGARATPTTSDSVAQSFKLNNASSSQVEFARISAIGSSLTAGAETGALQFSVVNSGSLVNKLYLSAAQLSPLSNGGLTLGGSGLGFGNAFFAANSVHNWDSGNVTLTHSAGQLTLATASTEALTIDSGSSISVARIRSSGSSAYLSLQNTGGTAAAILIGVQSGGDLGMQTASGKGMQVQQSGGSYTYMKAAAITAMAGTSIPAGGTAGAGVMVSSTSNFGMFFGSGAPTLSAAQGSLYLRSDGSSTSTRLYVNTNGSTGWTNVTTAA